MLDIQLSGDTWVRKTERDTQVTPFQMKAFATARPTKCN
jgi:hypothetical protein